MMHGFGTYRMLERLIEQTLNESQRQRDEYRHPEDAQAGIRREVKMMYARGDISRDTYRRLLEMAEQRQLDWEDLERVRREAGDAAQPAVVPRAPAPQRDPAVVSSLNRLYRHRSRLEEARADTQQVLERLEGDAGRLRAQVEEAGERARLALPDEQRARAYLELKQEAQGRLNLLAERIATLQESLDRIGALREELATREAELKALESAGRLSELEADIRQDLLDGRSEN